MSLGAQEVSHLGTASLGTASWTPAFAPGSNLTAVCRSATTSLTHSILAPGAAVRLRLSLDAPSAAKGTGAALLLDGQDVALLRAEVLDADGSLVTTSTANVTFEVSAGPGRVIGSHNGDPACHTPNLAPWHEAFHGLARGIVQVTVDAASARRPRLIEVDAEGGRRTRIVPPTSVVAHPKVMTVTASSPGLAPASADIPLSVDARRHSVLAAAVQSLGQKQHWVPDPTPLPTPMPPPTPAPTPAGCVVSDAPAIGDSVALSACGIGAGQTWNFSGAFPSSDASLPGVLTLAGLCLDAGHGQSKAALVECPEQPQEFLPYGKKMQRTSDGKCLDVCLGRWCESQGYPSMVLET